MKSIAKTRLNFSFYWGLIFRSERVLAMLFCFSEVNDEII
jgi:hypothetical protein